MPSESAYMIVERVSGKHDLKEIKRGLDRLHGVTSVSVNPSHNLVAVDYDSSGTSYDAIEHQLNTLGYEVAADASNINTR
mgnify:FL=1